MGYNVTCDWCNSLVLKTNKPSDIRAKLQEGEVVCDKCRKDVEDLKKYYETQRDKYTKQLGHVHDKAQIDLEKFIKKHSSATVGGAVGDSSIKKQD